MIGLKNFVYVRFNTQFKMKPVSRDDYKQVKLNSTWYRLSKGKVTKISRYDQR